MSQECFSLSVFSFLPVDSLHSSRAASCSAVAQSGTCPVRIDHRVVFPLCAKRNRDKFGSDAILEGEGS